MHSFNRSASVRKGGSTSAAAEHPGLSTKTTEALENNRAPQAGTAPHGTLLASVCAAVETYGPRRRRRTGINQIKSEHVVY